ncbi:lipid II:glycine glycyltransferase FemX [Bifidobacterium aerophilum]|uniref:GNAT family N-acetyltransferase n=1 Tax=Bifidobacterium aerophilum TaxID=1798155 RepID=A0A6N9Z6X4_9BIFI|nr:GNAT family N-acetyltransferase [Bifidobacterium aerophilum]NEG90114.1 GNAT family N-acetyltransferase [Bifidobacterium aerophilum]
MITLEAVTPEVLEASAAEHDISLPIEQTAVWAAYQADIDGRTPWGAYVIRRDDDAVAFISFIDYETHGYHYLHAAHGPVWIARPTPAEEREVIDALTQAVHAEDPGIVFLRIDAWFEDGTEPVLSTVPYDETVIVDLTGGDDAILGRMRKRGRRDVRKALRESPADCRDETESATADFSEYYDVMVETAQRDGFSPAPMDDYTDMIAALGPDHCRVFAARIDGRVVAWSIVTLNGARAVYYYACMSTAVMHDLVPDKLLYTFCCALGAQGYTQIDLMGIGDDFSPSLKSLNMFKTKFTEETTPVAPARDVPIRKVFYGTLTAAEKLRDSLREH